MNQQQEDVPKVRAEREYGNVFCPVCGGGYVHPDKVEVGLRDENSDVSRQVATPPSDVKASDDEDNPFDGPRQADAASAP